MTMTFNQITDTAHTITAVVLPRVTQPDGLEIVSRPIPTPGREQALVRVEATGISFAEQQMIQGRYPGQPRFPFVPGYDLVGVVEAIGPEGDAGLVGRRVAALTKVGGWATDVVLDVRDLVPVPDGIDPADAETVVVNGLTAWKLLHRTANVRSGQTIVVLGASGGVGSTLVQLARHAGVRVIGTASARNQNAVRALGAEPVDYRDPDVPARIRELAPDGVDAVFDHVGGPGLTESFRLLRRSGTLVAYGTLGQVSEPGNAWLKLGRVAARLAWWSVLPNGRRARLFDVWAGRLRNRAAFRAALREDLGQVFALLADGTIAAQVGARYGLTDVAEAMHRAASGTITGKVVLLPVFDSVRSGQD